MRPSGEVTLRRHFEKLGVTNKIIEFIGRVEAMRVVRKPPPKKLKKKLGGKNAF